MLAVESSDFCGLSHLSIVPLFESAPDPCKQRGGFSTINKMALSRVAALACKYGRQIVKPSCVEQVYDWKLLQQASAPGPVNRFGLARRANLMIYRVR